MINQLNTDTLKAVGVRYAVNPELGHRGVVETEEMCQKTIAKLKWLDENRPRVVLMADSQNKDTHAVMVRALGEKIAYIDMNSAPEIHGMLKETPRGMLSTCITEVRVNKHGFFYVKKPSMDRAFTPEEIGVDWSIFQVSEPFLLPSEYFDSHDELSMVIEDELFPDLANVSEGELRMYIDRWLSSVRYNQSREVQHEMLRFISLLSADPREEIRSIAVNIDHLCTKKNSSEVITEMSEVWWKDLLQSSTVNDSFSVVVDRCQNDRHQLLLLLDKVEELLRSMPGDLYNDMGDTYEFFSHLAYLAPPKRALIGVLSLFALRSLICKELNLPTTPFFGKRVEAISDVRKMPTTIGKVFEFAETQCKDHAELVTAQRIIDFLRQDYLDTRDEQVENILNICKPATNIFVDKNYGPCNGNIQEQRLQLPPPSTSMSKNQLVQS